ncbi:hypothetical protein ZIOFF_061704 [Zingiber officinale]|uniref:MLLE-like domain-containing protein n=1 Tax=Zingiber officinale TaxID=94328 RepID=A0A8J5F4D0_ZINOF|nr:hypothetical protein ZIOFF_061704 [Zingiber officinale]
MVQAADQGQMPWAGELRPRVPARFAPQIDRHALAWKERSLVNVKSEVSQVKTHKEAKGMWDFKFPYLNQLELVYGRDRAIGAIVQGYVDAIYNLEVDQNDESGCENLEENLREKMASERMKDVIAELMNLSLPSGDVFKVANIFTADKDKIDVLFNLPSELRRNYVVSLLIPSSNM